jgi:hypothetical protein
MEVVISTVTDLESVTIDLCCGGHTAYVADMSTCRQCGDQFCHGMIAHAQCWSNHEKDGEFPHPVG